MATRFIRRGRASKPATSCDLDDDHPRDGEEISSDIENADELGEWLATKPTGHLTHILPHQSLVRKYLPPGTVADLYEHYKSTQQMLGAYFASYLDKKNLDKLYIILILPNGFKQEFNHFLAPNDKFPLGLVHQKSHPQVPKKQYFPFIL